MIGQLHDENQAYTIAFRRFDLAMSMASKVISQVEQDADYSSQKRPATKFSSFETR